MVFTSYTYLNFLALVFLLHWTVPGAWRKPLLIVASYVFYCSWRWELGFLLLGVSLFNWSYARWVLTRWTSVPVLFLGVAANLAPLIYFKYTGFFLANAAAAANWLGAGWHFSPWDIILPLGISFFTFQGIAYLVDVATGDEPLNCLPDFLLFKALWPQLIAGPIIRLHEIRAQLETPRSLEFDDVAFGCRRILFGFFKKIVLADNLAPIVDTVFMSKNAPNAVDCMIGIFGFGLQIYFDFSAYSEIAIGSARLFGYRFPENFNWPYVSAGPAEFWNRWHMTLSSWIRDYVFTPLTFMARNRPALGALWLLLAMALCGLWHGAQWTFVLWGLWHGVLLVLNRLVPGLFPRPPAPGEPTFRWRYLPAILITLVLVNFGWLFFRAQSLEQAWTFLHSMASLHGGPKPSLVRENSILVVAAIMATLLLAEICRDRWMQLTQSRMELWSWGWNIVRSPVYALMIAAIIVFDRESQTFVYFQF